MEAIRTEGLTRRFRSLTAVDRLDVAVARGGVIGLVGPNGSGKSTLIRMLLGLVRPTSGTATVLGSPISRPTAYCSDVGALIESPAFVPALSARANLTSLAHLRGLPTSRVDDVLATVGLIGREAEPVKRFSLGMKQRLGIAAALLPDPKLLILDEPTNGLDPAGIVEIRQLITKLASEGRTVIVSSHLLNEIQAICDHLVIIRFGELVFEGPLQQLLAKASAHVAVAPERLEDAPALASVLRKAGWHVDDSDSPTLRVEAGATDAAALNRTAQVAGVTLAELTAHVDTLESIFIELTGATDGELSSARAQQTAEVA